MLIGALAQYFFGFTIFVLSTFLILLVLVQRGRGGGLTGALGGPGGQSAFGTKAGDLFTRITIGVATAWILLCATAVFMLRNRALPQTGSSDRPVAKSTLGATANSGTTATSENTSTLPKLDLPNLNLPKSDLPDLKPSDLKPSDLKPSDQQPSDQQPSDQQPSDQQPSGLTPELTPAAPTGTDTPPTPK